MQGFADEVFDGLGSVGVGDAALDAWAKNATAYLNDGEPAQPKR